MNPWPEKWPRKFAITGSSGFVGRHLVQALIDEQFDVIALSRSADLQSSGEVVVVPDYTDVGRLKMALAGSSVVVHLAALAHQREGTQDAAAYDLANSHSTRAVAEACHAAGVRRMVFVSSIGVNGNRTYTQPFTENDTPSPIEAYARSKLEGERLMTACLADSSTDYVTLRPPLVYGPGCPGNFRLLLSLIARAPIVPLGSLHAPRHFIHVANLVQAIRVAATHPNASRRTFLLGDGRDVSVAEIARITARAMGRSPYAVWNVPPWFLAAIARMAGRGDAYSKLAAPLQVDTTAFQRLTGWSPEIESLHGITETALDFMHTAAHKSSGNANVNS